MARKAKPLPPDLQKFRDALRNHYYKEAFKLAAKYGHRWGSPGPRGRDGRGEP